jgi:D-tyrosyl-tRNA(Tyr) deacylase
VRALLQRVLEAKVTVAGTTVGTIQSGLLVLLGVSGEDSEAQADFLAQKTAKLRIFSDDAGKMNRSVQDIGGSVLVVSQFTLYADARRGNRPSFISAAPPEQAEALYERFIAQLTALSLPVTHGVFGADMKVHLLNDGPVTIMLDSRDYGR